MDSVNELDEIIKRCQKLGLNCIAIADHDELSWNVTGDTWHIPIQRASATITLPPGAPAPAMEAHPVALPLARTPVGAFPVEQRVGVEANAAAVDAAIVPEPVKSRLAPDPT